MSGGPDGLWDIQPATPSFLIAIPVAVIVTLLTPKPPDEVVELYDRVNPPKTADAPALFPQMPGPLTGRQQTTPPVNAHSPGA